MAPPSDDDPSDDETGPRFQKSGRLGRFVKMGGLAASITADTVKKRIGSAFQNEEQKAASARDLVTDSAQKMVRTMGEMKGAAMKVGQMLSVSPGAMPKELMDELKSLQKDSPPMPYEMVAKEIEKGLGRSLVDAFRFFDPKPLGAASIGQVHEAKLFDGRRVAVKVQYPGIADTLESDLKNIYTMMQMGRVVAEKAHLDAVFEELRKGILEEADYLKEADNLRKYGAILREHPRIVVPDVIDELSTQTVLTMTYLEGTKLDEALEKMPEEQKNQVARDFSETFVWMFHERQIIHADPHPGNYLWMPDGQIGFLDFGCFREFDPDFTDHFLGVLVAKWTHKKAALRPLHDAMGFKAMHGSAGLTNQQLDELTDIVLSPFLYDREFDWGEWEPQKPLEAYVKANLGMLKYAAPAQSIFYFRVCAGIWGFLKRCRAKGNWFLVAQAMAKKRQLM